MKTKRGFLRVYLIIALVMGIIDLLDNLLTWLKFDHNIYSLILITISLLFFFFNIISIPLFYFYRVERIAFVMPIYHLSSYLIFFAAGLILELYKITYPWIWTALIVIGVLASIFEITFSIYLIRKLILLKKENL